MNYSRFPRVPAGRIILLALPFLAVPMFAATIYTVIDLGTLGGAESGGLGINASG
jgi:probable HAF family extracellular repeat protein